MKHKATLLQYHDQQVTHMGRVSEMYGSHAPKLSAGTILDMGCSLGLTTKEIAALYPGCHVVGSDIDEEAIAKACAYAPELEFVIDDGYRSQLPRGGFDLVFCNNNLSYVAQRAPSPALKKIMRSIGGLVSPHGMLAMAHMCAGVNNDFAVYSRIVISKSRGRYEIKDLDGTTVGEELLERLYLHLPSA